MTTVMNIDNRDAAADYAQLNQERQAKHGRGLLDELALKKGERFFDIGAGTGDLLKVAAETVGEEGSALGIEPMEDRVAIANDSLVDLPQASCVVGGAADIAKLVTQPYNVAISNSTMHWVPRDERQQAFVDIYNALYSGGRIGISGGSGDHWQAQDLKTSVLFDGNYAKYQHQGIAYFLKQDELVGYLRTAGFVDIQPKIVTLERQYSNKEDFVKWLNASSMNNFTYVNYLPASQREGATQAIQKNIDEFVAKHATAYAKANGSDEEVEDGPFEITVKLLRVLAKKP